MRKHQSITSIFVVAAFVSLFIPAVARVQAGPDGAAGSCQNGLFRSRASDPPRDGCDGSGHRGSRLVDRGM
jgi:hypothetical protein